MNLKTYAQGKKRDIKDHIFYPERSRKDQSIATEVDQWLPRGQTGDELGMGTGNLFEVMEMFHWIVDDGGTTL